MVWGIGVLQGSVVRALACLAGACAAVGLVAGPTAASDFLTFDFADAPSRFEPVPQRAGMTRFAMLDAISFEGAAGPARLVIELALPAQAELGTQPVDARVTYRPDGFTQYWQTIAIAPDAFVFETLALSGPTPRIVGTFEVSLCLRLSLMQPANPAQCQTASGRFDTALQID
jgi:hypothetical protein